MVLFFNYSYFLKVKLFLDLNLDKETLAALVHITWSLGIAIIKYSFWLTKISPKSNLRADPRPKFGPH